MKIRTALDKKIHMLITADIALYKAELDWKRINFYHQMPKSLQKPLAE